MKENPHISIIIPVYKAEKYLRDCLDSIAAQTFTDWECILIDDGSPDGSGRICDEYAVRDSRFIAVHQKNGGASAARNAGLAIARGDWIGFVDADDWIEPETYGRAFEAIVEHGADIVQWGIYIEADGRVIRSRVYREGLFSLERDATYLEPSMCHKLVSKKLICDNHILFPEGLTLSEDRYFSFLCYLNSSKNYALHDKFYHYRMNQGSATHNMTEKNIRDEVEVIALMEDAVIKSEKCDEWQNILTEQKIEAKNHALFLLEEPDCKLWRKLYPEALSAMMRAKNKKLLLYVLLRLHLDVLVKLIIKVYVR